MIPCKRLDIAWTDLFLGIGYCLKLENHRSIELRLEGVWPQGTASLACLSVRSGCDALLQTLDFELGTEILVVASTIRSMTRIIEAHGLGRYAQNKRTDSWIEGYFENKKGQRSLP